MRAAYHNNISSIDVARGIHNLYVLSCCNWDMHKRECLSQMDERSNRTRVERQSARYCNWQLFIIIWRAHIQNNVNYLIIYDGRTLGTALRRAITYISPPTSVTWNFKGKLKLSYVSVFVYPCAHLSQKCRVSRYPSSTTPFDANSLYMGSIVLWVWNAFNFYFWFVEFSFSCTNNAYHFIWKISSDEFLDICDHFALKLFLIIFSKN